MHKTHHYKVILKMHLLLSLLLLILACNDSRKCPSVFILPIQIQSIKSEYRLGDTITWISKFSSQLHGYDNDGKDVGLFDVKDINWLPVFFVYNMDSIFEVHSSILTNFFDFIYDHKYNFDIIDYTGGSSGLIGQYNFDNDSFSLVFKIIPTTIGTFFSEFGCYSDQLVGKDFENCNGKYNVWSSMNNDSNNNFNLLLDSPDPFYNSWIPGNIETNFTHMGGYCFKVVP